MARLSNFLLCGWRLLFSISAPSRGSSVQAAMYSNSLSGTDGTCHTMVLLTLFRCSGGSGKPTASSAMRQLGCGGLTRRLRRGRWGCRPEEGSTFFRSERKYQRKPAARHSGKKAFIAHFGGGARNVARNGVGQLSPAFGARSCSPFSAVKMGGPFSLRCLSPLCSATAGVGRSHIATVEMLWCNWKVPQHQWAELFHN